MARSFSDGTLTTIRISGREFLVGPMTIGMRRRVERVMGKIPAPKPVTVDVQGLIEAMFRAPGSDGISVDGSHPAIRPIRMVKTQEAIQAAVAEQMREIRSRIEQWPPSMADPEGINLVNSDPTVQNEVIWEMLHRHNPGFRREELEEFVEDMTIMELRSVMDLAFPQPDDEDSEADGPKSRSSDAGGDPASSPGLPNGNGSTIPSTTPTSSAPAGAGLRGSSTI